MQATSWGSCLSSFVILTGALFALSDPIKAEDLGKAKDDKKDAGTLIFRFEGGLVPANAAEVLKILKNHNAVTSKTAPAPIKNSEDLCRVFKTEVNFPGNCSEEMAAVAAEYDPNPKPSRERPERAEAKIPDVRFKNYTYTVRFDESSPASMAKLEELRKHWSAYIRKEEHRNGYTILTLSGYQIRLDDVEGEKAKEVLKDIHQSDRKNVLAEYYSAGSGKVMYSTFPSVREYWSALRQDKVPPGNEGYYANELFKGSTFPYCQVQCNGNCPKLLMPDTPVAAHPDLAGVIVQEDGTVVPNAQPVPTITSSCCSETEWVNTFHGTYGAGIIASQKNGFGLVGVFPEAKIIPYPWVTATGAAEAELQLRKLLDRRVNASEPTIVVFASDWSFGGEFVRDAKLDNPDYRLTKSLLNKAVIDGQMLWIVAAGQPKKFGETVEDIEPSTPRGPVNLGDKPYIIVVTACENCDSRGSTSRLMSDVNYSTQGMVHIAAPGIPLPGLADSTSYTTSPGGTSSSTVFVAAVAAALMSCYPDNYRYPWQVKDRIQITADPFPRQEDAKKLTGGMINPETALLDPRTAWLRKASHEDRKKITVEAWCEKTITLLDSATGDVLSGENGDEIGHISTTTIARIQEIKSNGQRQWMVYGKNLSPGHEGRFYRKGPGTLGPVKGRQQGAKTLQPLIKTSAGLLAIADIGELILQPYQKEDLQCAPPNAPRQ